MLHISLNLLMKSLFILISTSVSACILTSRIIKIMKQRQIVGVDVHKLEKPIIPERGGIAIFGGLSIGVLLCIFLFSGYWIELVTYWMVIIIATIIGWIDDSRRLGAITKPFILIFASFPIIIAGTYTGRPYLPIIGRTRLTVIYLILILLIISISSNTVNQFDVLNGVMPETSIIILIGAIVASIILNAEVGWILIFPILGAIVGYYPFNKYPAKVFSGDTGSLCVGAAIGAIAIIGRLEIVILTALMPHITNSFAILSSMRRLKERHEMLRPTKVLEDGRLAATTTREAPITLTRLVLARGPLSEYQIIRVIFLLVAFSTCLAIFATLLIPTGY